MTAVVDLEEVRAYRNDIRSRCVQVQFTVLHVQGGPKKVSQINIRWANYTSFGCKFLVVYMCQKL